MKRNTILLTALLAAACEINNPAPTTAQPKTETPSPATTTTTNGDNSLKWNTQQWNQKKWQ